MKASYILRWLPWWIAAAALASLPLLLAAQPPMPMAAVASGDVAGDETNAPVTYPATVTWDAVTNATRYVVMSRVGTNLTIATNLVVPFIPGTNIVQVSSANTTQTSPPSTLVWEGYPGVIVRESLQYAATPAGPWQADTNSVRWLTNPPSGLFRIRQERWDTLIGGPQ